MIELTVIAAILNNGEQYLQHISPHMFSSDIPRFMFQSIKQVHERTGKVPSLAELKILLYQRYDDGDSKKKIRRFLRVLSGEDISDEFAKDTITNLIQKSQLRKFLEKIIPQLDSVEPLNMELIRAEIAKISDNASSKFELTNLDDTERRDWSDGGVPTFSNQLNDYLLGGLFPGEIGLIQANPGIGKTLSVINIACASAITGFDTWIVTLDEMKKDIATRMDLKLASYSGKRTWTKRIHLIDFSEGARTSDLQMALEIYGTPGLILVDGTDDFLDGVGDTRTRLNDIYKNLRRITRRKAGPVPMWLTTQSTASSEGKFKKGMFDTTENKVIKAAESSVIISMNQTDEEAEQGLARMYLSKARRPCGPGKMINIRYCRETQSLCDDDDSMDDIKENLNNTKRRSK